MRRLPGPEITRVGLRGFLGFRRLPRYVLPRRAGRPENCRRAAIQSRAPDPEVLSSGRLQAPASGILRAKVGLRYVPTPHNGVLRLGAVKLCSAKLCFDTSIRMFWVVLRP